jgi:hypothetical protein
MLGHLDLHRRQVEHLAALHPGDRTARQPGPPALRSAPRAHPARPAYARSASAATAAPACPAPRWKEAWKSSGNPASAAPQAQRSAAGHAQAPPVSLPVPGAATPPAPPAPQTAVGLPQRTHPDTTGQDQPAHSPNRRRVDSTPPVTLPGMDLTSYVKLRFCGPGHGDGVVDIWVKGVSTIYGRNCPQTAERCGYVFPLPHCGWLWRRRNLQAATGPPQ